MSRQLDSEWLSSELSNLKSQIKSSKSLTPSFDFAPNPLSLNNEDSTYPSPENIIWLPARYHPEISPNEYKTWISKYGTQLKRLESSPRRRKSILGLSKPVIEELPESNLKKSSSLSCDKKKEYASKKPDSNVIHFMVNKRHEPTLKRSKLLNKRRTTRIPRSTSLQPEGFLDLQSENDLDSQMDVSLDRSSPLSKSASAHSPVLDLDGTSFDIDTGRNSDVLENLGLSIPIAKASEATTVLKCVTVHTKNSNLAKNINIDHDFDLDLDLNLDLGLDIDSKTKLANSNSNSNLFKKSENEEYLPELRLDWSLSTDPVSGPDSNSNLFTQPKSKPPPISIPNSNSNSSSNSHASTASKNITSPLKPETLQRKMSNSTSSSSSSSCNTPSSDNKSQHNYNQKLKAQDTSSAKSITTKGINTKPADSIELKKKTSIFTSTMLFWGGKKKSSENLVDTASNNTSLSANSNSNGSKNNINTQSQPSSNQYFKSMSKSKNSGNDDKAKNKDKEKGKEKGKNKTKNKEKNKDKEKDKDKDNKRSFLTPDRPTPAANPYSSNGGLPDSKSLSSSAATAATVATSGPTENAFSNMSQIVVRYPLHVERAIYQLAGLKLSNPRRPLHHQVLLSNMMYWYLELINPFKRLSSASPTNSPPLISPSSSPPPQQSQSQSQLQVSSSSSSPLPSTSPTPALSNTNNDKISVQKSPKNPKNPIPISQTQAQTQVSPKTSASTITSTTPTANATTTTITPTTQNNGYGSANYNNRFVDPIPEGSTYNSSGFDGIYLGFDSNIDISNIMHESSPSHQSQSQGQYNNHTQEDDFFARGQSLDEDLVITASSLVNFDANDHDNDDLYDSDLPSYNEYSYILDPQSHQQQQLSQAQTQIQSQPKKDAYRPNVVSQSIYYHNNMLPSLGVYSAFNDYSVPDSDLALNMNMNMNMNINMGSINGIGNAASTNVAAGDDDNGGGDEIMNDDDNLPLALHQPVRNPNKPTIIHSESVLI